MITNSAGSAVKRCGWSASGDPAGYGLAGGGVGDRPRPQSVLLVSGYSGTEMSERHALDPHIPMLAKPWSVEELLQHVRDLLRD